MTVCYDIGKFRECSFLILCLQPLRLNQPEVIHVLKYLLVIKDLLQFTPMKSQADFQTALHLFCKEVGVPVDLVVDAH